VLTFHRWAGNPRPRARRLFAEVEAWFASSHTDGPFAFVTICESLDFDAAYIRRGLREWRPARPQRRGAPRVPIVLPRLRRVA
jgi:hypothetical protein